MERRGDRLSRRAFDWNIRGAGLVLALVWASFPWSADTSSLSQSPGITGLHVVGNQILNGAGQPVRLLGVNRSGTEYACAQGWAIFDGPVDAAAISSIVAWHTNAVRVPLNSACWLDLQAQLNPYNSAYTGANYRNAIVGFVQRLNAAGLYAILELHWNGCGTNTCLANWQKVMPDRPYAGQFWASVAATFAGTPGVLFDLFNEPAIDDWGCWRNGGCTLYQGSTNQYTAAGMQEMLDAVRGAGATQVVMAGGLQYANDLSGWLANRPTDPTGNLAASWHVYNFNACNNLTCYGGAPQQVGAAVPLITGEIGEDDGGHGFIDPLMGWLDQRGHSYLAWTWNTWGCGGAVLISDYSGTPCQTFGQGYKDHLAVLANNPTPTPTAMGSWTSGTTASGGRPSAPPTAAIPPMGTATAWWTSGTMASGASTSGRARRRIVVGVALCRPGSPPRRGARRGQPC